MRLSQCPSCPLLAICFFTLLRGGVVAQVLPPVEALQCACQVDAVGRPAAHLFWVNPRTENGFSIELRRDEAVLAVLPGEKPGEPQAFIDSAVKPGPHHYVLTVVDLQGQVSVSKNCAVDCPGNPPRGPRASILGPSRLVMPPAGIAEAIFDGRNVLDSRGTQALRYQWRVSGQKGGEVVSPASFVTRLRFRLPGLYLVELLVAKAPEFRKLDRTELMVEVLPPNLTESPELFPIDPRFLVAVVGRPVDIPLVAVRGLRFELIAVLSGPPDLEFLPEQGRIVWVPPPGAAGQDIPVVLGLDGVDGQMKFTFSIHVLDSVEPLVIHAFPLPNPAAGGGADGGGGTLSAAPLVLEDQSLAQPTLGLQLSLEALEFCAVQLVTQGDGDPFHGILFNPGCAGVFSSGLYFSGSSADKLIESIVNDFTIELWVSQVSPLLPPGGRSFIFSMSSGTADVNWLLGHNGGIDYTANVRVNGV